MTKSTYEIEKEMEQKFGKDFIKKMTSQKSEFERLSKELVEAKSLQEKINDKANELRKNFIHISDDYTFYPQETCGRFLRQYAKRCIEENLTPKQCNELQEEYELQVIKDIQDDIDTLQKQLNHHIECWEEV